MGLGKYFHKSDSPKATKTRSRANSLGNLDNDPGSGFQSSRYEAMPPAGLPQTGTYPIKGNNSSSAAVAGHNARTSMDPRPQHSSRPETAPTHRNTTTTTTTITTTSAPRIETPKTNNNFHFFEQDQPAIPARGSSQDMRRLQQDSGLENNFSGMNLGTDTAATSPPTSYYPGSGSSSNRIDPRVDSASRNDPTRMVYQAGQHAYKSPNYGRQTQNPQPQISPSYDSQSPTHGYGDASRGPISKQRSSGDFAPGYSQNSSTPVVNKRASVGYSQGYSQGYNQPARTSISDQRLDGNYGDIDETKAARRSSISRKPVAPAGNGLSNSSPVSAAYGSQPSSEPQPPVPKHGPYTAEQAYEGSRSTPQQSLPGQGSNYYGSQPKPKYHGFNSQSKYQEPSAVPQGLNYGAGATTQRNNHMPAAAPPLFPRAQPTSSAIDSRPIANDIVARAKSNTKDTEVIERIAPAVVQEKVIEKIHHKREEVITREIHTHDVYHRILPIIDVEVLPPRHFLPVEGGGLVEIGADEVPGRAKNWVIAETASKIPSDQPAPKGVSRFTAREFPGTEGDTVQYTTPEGVKRTEETWVHPPELEIGGKETGQTWPMVFGRDGPKQRKSKDGKKRRSSASAAAY